MKHARPELSRIAVIVCRDGVLPAGAVDAFIAARSYGVLVGSGAVAAASLLPEGRVCAIEAPVHLPTIARSLAALDVVKSAHTVVLPTSPDNRDLAGPLAEELDRPLITGATRLRELDGGMHVVAVRASGLVDFHHRVSVPTVVTVIGGRTTAAAHATAHAAVEVMSVGAETQTAPAVSVRSVAVLPPDPATMDLTEASCIVAGGQGLTAGAGAEGNHRFALLGSVGVRIGASLGGTRVASDAGWIPFERQIGTTGVEVSPRVYLAFGISGATQHTSGLGSPDHIISVNTDPSCPMMAMSEVAIVADAYEVVQALSRRLTEVDKS